MPNNKYIINESQLVDIADAIRTKLNEQDTYTVDEMPEKIDEIGGSSLSIANKILTLDVTTNHYFTVHGGLFLDENNKITQKVVNQTTLRSGRYDIIMLPFVDDSTMLELSSNVASASLTNEVNCSLFDDDGLYMIIITDPSKNASATLNVVYESSPIE